MVIGESGGVTDPRIQERRVRVARETGRRRRRRLVGFLGVVLAAGGGIALVHSSVFGARHIDISGSAHAPYSAVVRVAGLEGAPPLVDLSAAVIASRVESLPWVKTATVSLSFPSTVRIRVTDRVPVAAIALPQGRYAVADPTGRVLEDVNSKPLSLPLVEVAGRVPRPGGQLGRHDESLTLAAAAMPESMVPGTAAVRFGRDGIEVDLAQHRVAVLGGDTALADKFTALETVLRKADLSGIARIDLRVPSAPVLIR